MASIVRCRTDYSLDSVIISDLGEKKKSIGLSS
jgi:hypothetical protein